jgi:hypothetical protein
MRKILLVVLLLAGTLSSCAKEAPLGVVVGDTVKVVLESGGGLSRGKIVSYSEKTISVAKVNSWGEVGDVIVFQVENISSLTFLARK